MDSVSSFEFSEIFDRISSNINLQGKLSVHDIEKELFKAREQCRKRYFGAETMQERTRFKAAIKGYDNLLHYGFANRVIEEAAEEPRGFIAMVLIHGKIEAKRRLDAQRRSRMRFYMRPDYWKRR
jgi:hypothetical protein